MMKMDFSVEGEKIKKDLTPKTKGLILIFLFMCNSGSRSGFLNPEPQGLSNTPDSNHCFISSLKLQKPVNHLFIQVRCVEAGKHLKHVGQWALRTLNYANPKGFYTFCLSGHFA